MRLAFISPLSVGISRMVTKAVAIMLSLSRAALRQMHARMLVRAIEPVNRSKPLKPDDAEVATSRGLFSEYMGGPLSPA